MSAPLRLSLALSDNARTRPLLDGRVTPEGIRFDGQALHPSEMFWRQLSFEEFDVSELSISSFLIGLSRGRTTWLALPVFTTRKVFHTTVQVRVDSGIEVPADLAGKRVGVPEYQQTWAVWSRGVLAEEFGVDPRTIEWFMERGPDRSHGAATGFTPPPGVTVRQIAPETDIGRMLLAGELDATLLYLNQPNAVDRSTIDLDASPDIRTLFPDPEAEARRYRAKTGIHPINHLAVVRRSLVEEQPWIARAVYDAFVEAKALADGADGPDPYGVSANLKTIQTIARYVHDQGLADRRLGVEEIFAPETLAT